MSWTVDFRCSWLSPSCRRAWLTKQWRWVSWVELEERCISTRISFYRALASITSHLYSHVLSYLYLSLCISTSCTVHTSEGSKSRWTLNLEIVHVALRAVYEVDPKYRTTRGLCDECSSSSSRASRPDLTLMNSVPRMLLQHAAGRRTVKCQPQHCWIHSLHPANRFTTRTTSSTGSNRNKDLGLVA
jgi:hypothetical protein